MTRKDIIFLIIIILWLISDMILLFTNHVALWYIPQIVSMMDLTILIIFKIKNDTFNKWIEKNLMIAPINI